MERSKGISGNWVAIITIVVSAIVNIFTVMYGMSAEAELERIKIEGSYKKAEAQYQWNQHDNLCKTYSRVASSIARANAEVNREFNLDHDSDLEAAIWEGIILLSEDAQNILIKDFATGPEKGDQYGLIHRDKLITLTLSYLAMEARKCALGEKI